MENNNIPTASEFLDKHIRVNGAYCYIGPSDLIEFAKMHVQAALKEASELATTYLDDSWNYVVREDSILNAYPLDNIK